MKERTKKEYFIKSGETYLLVPFSGITAFPEHDNEQDVDRLAKVLDRMRLRNKQKRRAKKSLKKQLEAFEKKLKILKDFNVVLEKKLENIA